MKNVTIYWDDTDPSIKNEYLEQLYVDANYEYSSTYNGNISIEFFGTNNEVTIQPQNDLLSVKLDFTELYKLINLGTLNFNINCLLTDNGSNAVPDGIKYTIVENLNIANDTCFTSLSQFPTSLQNLNLGFSDTQLGLTDINGEIEYINNFTVLTSLKIYGTNNISGNIDNFIENQNLNFFEIEGNNTIQGDVIGFKTYFPNTQILKLLGNNTILGDVGNISATINEITIGGNNTLNGSKFPVFKNLKSIIITGQTTNFDIDLRFLPTSNYINFSTNGNLSGDLANLINCPNTTLSASNITSLSYTNRTNWDTFTLQNIEINVTNGFIDSSILDNFFNDLNNTCTQFVSPSSITIKGKVSTSSQSARDNLNSVYGVNINIYT